MALQMSDSRKEEVVKAVLDIFGGESSNPAASTLTHRMQTDPCVDRFLDDPDTILLQVYTTKGSADIQIRNSTKADKNISFEVHLLKKMKAALPQQNVAQHFFATTTLESSLWSLYLSIHNIYSPLLKTGNSVDPGLQKLMAQLEKGLRNAILLNGRSSKISDKESDFSGVRSFSDELEFWKKQAAKGMSGTSWKWR
mmetsp:Transcript_40005/g.78649  ORF Transcript_40005/g.78649 Transcript_40005/m.78649 type:complete len:197 (+) Transcript_40005:171-761(+)